MFFETVSSSMSAGLPSLTRVMLFAPPAILGGVLVYLGLAREKKAEADWHSDPEGFAAPQPEKGARLEMGDVGHPLGNPDRAGSCV